MGKDRNRQIEKCTKNLQIQKEASNLIQQRWFKTGGRYIRLKGKICSKTNKLPATKNVQNYTFEFQPKW